MKTLETLATMHCVCVWGLIFPSNFPFFIALFRRGADFSFAHLHHRLCTRRKWEIWYQKWWRVISAKHEAESERGSDINWETEKSHRGHKTLSPTHALITTHKKAISTDYPSMGPRGAVLFLCITLIPHHVAMIRAEQPGLRRKADDADASSRIELEYTLVTMPNFA